MRRVVGVCMALAACRAEDAPPEEQRKLEPDRPVPRPFDEQARQHAERALLPDAPPPALVDAAPPTFLGCFALPQRLPLARRAASLNVADFDGDQQLDVLVSGSADDALQLQLYKNAGAGVLGAAPATPAMFASAPKHGGYVVTVGDLDGDGTVDLAVGDAARRRVYLASNRGDGTFAPRSPVTIGRPLASVDLVDLDGDGKLDLQVGFLHGVQTYRGSGNLKFTPRPVVMTRRAPEGPAVADFDGDARLDLAYVAHDDPAFFTLRGTRSGFKPGFTAETCVGPSDPTAGDLDDDGDQDVIYHCGTELVLQRNNGVGTFESLSLPYGGGRASTVIAELTGDGKRDMVAAQRVADDHDRLVLLAGEGNAAFAWRAGVDLDPIEHIAAADLDGDQRTDLLVATSRGLTGELLVLLQRACSPP